jgi:alkanesulfonate monooxygenase SsuD/methylene tetrahydromethanopterin reductase-like flavin-dependent oxidoreductase (luciferase family)
MKETIDAFRKGAAEAGPQPAPLQISAGQWVYVAKDDAEVTEKLKMAYANHQRFMNLFTTPGIVKGGIVQPIEITDTLDSLRDALIIGTPNHCVDKLLELKEQGYDHLVLRTHFGPPHEDIMRSLDRFGEYIMPHLRTSAARVPELVTQEARLVDGSACGRQLRSKRETTGSRRSRPDTLSIRGTAGAPDK